MAPADHEFDVFISHASEDKDAVVRPLANLLRQLGVSVWFDEAELVLGDSLSRSIDHGLNRSNYGLVVLSKAFFAKRWPERELSALVAMEMASARNRILPLWFEVSRDEVGAYSWALADKLAFAIDAESIEEAAAKVVSVVRPALYEQIQRRLLAIRLERIRPTQEIPRERIRPGPIRHTALPPSLVVRIHNLAHVFRDVTSPDKAGWLESFQRDLHPEREVQAWEVMAAVYCEVVAGKTNANVKRGIFAALLDFSLGLTPEEVVGRGKISLAQAQDLYSRCAAVRSMP